MAEIVTKDNTILQAKRNRLSQGLAPNDEIIGRYRNTDYAVFKQSINPRANGNVDLILTGSFSNQLFVKSLNNSRFLFDSRDEKAPMLFGRSYHQGVNGKVLRGLDKQTFDDLQRKDYAYDLISYIKQITNL